MPAIIGTAGHIDHGKTSLIKALTGQDTDRLKEEKERGISIDLGFAYYETRAGDRVGIVDVPGHERFIRNMLAGAHGIDVVLLVVAADDGVMPQTEEHFEILHLLGVRRGIGVITKTDLVAPARVDGVREELNLLLQGTSMEAVPIVAVSAHTGAGLDALREAIERELQGVEPRAASGLFRLPIDRAFVIKGHGVVVTGTAIAGTVQVGQALRLLPGGEECRVRGVQVHGQSVSQAEGGERVALNLAGVERTEVARGHMLVHPRLARSTWRFDAVIEVCPGAKRPLRSHSSVRCYHGTAEVFARLIVLGAQGGLAIGDRGYVQLALQGELAALYGDRFILRDRTGRRTVAGGRVLQPFAERHRRREEAGRRTSALAEAVTPAAVVSALVSTSSETAVPLAKLGGSLNLRDDEILSDVKDSADLVLLPGPESPEAVATRQTLEGLCASALAFLADFHRSAPSQPGADLEAVRAGVAPELSAKLFRTVIQELVRSGEVARDENLLRLSSHRAALGAGDQERAAKLIAVLDAAIFTPPDLKQLETEVGMPRRELLELLAALERQGRVARVAPELFFSVGAVESARGRLTEYTRAHGEITAATFRDLIGASRKFSIALLDYFDRTGYTLRVGDVRKLRR